MSTINNDLEKSLDILLVDLLNLKKNEKLQICGDQGSDQNVLEAMVTAGERIGAITTVNVRSVIGLKDEPDIDLALAMRSADVICDFSGFGCLYYTRAWEKALETGARGYCLGNLSSEAVIRCIGKVDINEVTRLGRILAKKTLNAHVIKITSKSGTNITLRMNMFTKLNSFIAPKFLKFMQRTERFLSFIYRTQRFHTFMYGTSWVGDPTGICHKSGQSTFLSGQVSFNGIKRSINGILAFDGSVYPPFELGILGSPIFCKIRNGKIIDIIGDQEAKIFRKWLENFTHASMFDIVHFSYGFNPGAKLSGCISEDERVYGCIEVGIGRYPSHTDGIIIKRTGNIVRKPRRE